MCLGGVICSKISKKTLAMKRPCPYVQEVGLEELEVDDFSVEVIVLAMPSQGGRIMK